MSRKVLVTAGASGIGKHIAAAFIRSGADVYTCDINEEALKSAAAELKGLKTGVCNVGDRTHRAYDSRCGEATWRYRCIGQ